MGFLQKFWFKGLGFTVLLFMLISSASAAERWNLVLQFSVDHPVTMTGFQNDRFGLTVGYAGESHYTNDAGKTWPEGNNQSQCRYGLEIVNDKVAWSSGNGANIRYTTDGGSNWYGAQDFGGFVPSHCRYMSFIDEKTGWVANSIKLGFTNDQGQHWQVVALPAEVNEIKAVDLRTAQDGCLMDQNGMLFSTNDAGKTWWKTSLGLNAADYYLKPTNTTTAAMRFFDAAHGVVIVRQLKPVNQWLQLTTSDGGKTWNRQVVPGKIGTIFLTRDGQYVTITDSMGVIEVYRRN